MCPTALGRKEKKLYNVHIVQCHSCAHVIEEVSQMTEKMPSVTLFCHMCTPVTLVTEHVTILYCNIFYRRHLSLPRLLCTFRGKHPVF